MALTNWNDILNKPKGIDEVPEIALTVEQLSASVLSLGEDVGEIAEDVQEIALEVSQLSASNLPYSSTQSTKQVIDEVNNNIPQILQAQFSLASQTTIPASGTATVLDHFDITNSSIRDGLHNNKTLAQLLGGKTILGVVFLYSNGGTCCSVDTIVWEDENTISVVIKNVSTASVDVWAIRLLIFYK